MAGVKPEVAVVTGASGGIGLAVAERLVADGYAVVCCDLRGDVLRREADRIGAALAVPADVADSGRVEALAAEAGALGAVRVLVNAAGVHRPAPFAEATEEDFDVLMRVNVKGTFLPSRALAPLMARAGGGSIVNFSSVASHHVTETSALYAASKGAVLSLTRGMAVSLAPSGVRVNAVSPGPVETPMNAGRREDAQYLERMVGRVPLGRQGRPAEVAEAVSFLVGERSSWVTGTVLEIDGGLSVLR